MGAAAVATAGSGSRSLNACCIFTFVKPQKQVAPLPPTC